MPELPEIETIRKNLTPEIIGLKINDLVTYRDKIRNRLPQELSNLVKDAEIKSIVRRSKYLIFELSNEYSLIFHLGMSGRLTLQQSDYNPLKHDHVIINLSDKRKLVFNDARRFGVVDLEITKDIKGNKYFKNLGPEPLTDEFNEQYLIRKLAKLKSPIKTVLMNAEIVVGVGNIYASESLYLAKISPMRPACSLNLNEIKLLIKSIKAVLEKAILFGGSTLKDYVSAHNKAGAFQNEFTIYGREGKECKACQGRVNKIVQSNRATYFCPKCQI